MTCPYLEYRTGTEEQEFETERAFCVAIESFVEPARADICNDRYRLSHDRDCEFYRAQPDQ